MKTYEIGRWTGIFARWMVYVNGSAHTGCLTRWGALRVARRWKRLAEQRASLPKEQV